MEEKNYKNRWKILAVVLLSPFMGNLDSSIVNIALPMISKHLSVEINSIQWVVTSYLIVISAFVLIFGKLSDKFGRNIIFNYGFLIFGLGSFLCAISNTLSFLVFSRVVQALGAAMFMSANQSILAITFPKNERGRAFGLLGSTVAIGTMLGPPIGGLMVQFFNWQSIFLINIPISILAFVSGKIILPKEEISRDISKFDLKGAILLIVFIVSLFWSLLKGEDLGWSNERILISFVIAILCGIGFYFIEKKAEDPIIDLSMFKNKLFDISILCAFISFVVLFCVNIIQPFYLQDAIKISPATSGILMMAIPVSIALIAPLSGYLSDRLSGEILTIFGLLIMSIGLFSMSFLNATSSYIHIAISIAIIGIGNGLFQAPNNAIVMSLVSKDKLGVVGSINALVRNVGMVSGITFSVALLYNRMSSKIGHRVTGYVSGRPEIFLYAMRIVYMSTAVICILGMLLTIIRILKERQTRRSI
ncbi:drug resistance transporter, EmrB/QacA subfamily [Clostridium pasteurianum DSM 525 = ATCC 6013]|uniref:Drug resistance transporter, EmrB/QacA subfamily n=1 Tax=Clostridium pasteurianum DSM 525 = ATCC 6013 TaxID=1262449 RepID=A0A0H3IYA6_CLOPA|nr:MFS transporter [Clostridium pasteurianum]AJA46486.1 drug resistance transporter, EmrB/QacA subfamily [Clostridium pasteurianum DSM 525 = ATCC 6013]AJA50474.1 drug resistance transporter, EmrB/QacA subfamily [Clostridium pasteurianum DSM 525 = ATCC 6013]AOZ73913.1 multidrug MFS transporter [Clostridium pasteurianum DSM 525 = ATCC 6013]AOZ77710.1 multidrug MFS transporter [Clostridium pasteurianum]ELP61059.1 EmrB/QacA family drug resistance transporter [Clostridium pasteurianum DSM 525 = ATC